MCLEHLTTEEPLVAQQNIFCWKYLDDGRRSHHQDHYAYELGVPQEETKLEVISYRHKGRTVHRGFHSWKKRIVKGLKANNANHLFVIPKGTEYYEGTQHDDNLGYASTNIICLGHVYSPMTWFRAFKYQSQNDNNAKIK
jgi:hypothetical protein